MTEEQLNKKYLKEILPNCEDEEIEIINKLMSEQYIKGLRQGKFDAQMDLCSYLENKIKEHKKYDRKNICEWQGYRFYQDILERIKNNNYD